jgi:hypothetical protein
VMSDTQRVRACMCVCVCVSDTHVRVHTLTCVGVRRAYVDACQVV